MTTTELSATTLDDYYRKVGSGYQVRELACSLCDHTINLHDVPKKSEFGDSNLGKVSRLRGAMRSHLRKAHALEIALAEETKRRA